MPHPHTASKLRLGCFAADPRDLRVELGLLRSSAVVRGLEVRAAARLPFSSRCASPQPAAVAASSQSAAADLYHPRSYPRSFLFSIDSAAFVPAPLSFPRRRRVGSPLSFLSDRAATGLIDFRISLNLLPSGSGCAWPPSCASRSGGRARRCVDSYSYGSDDGYSPTTTASSTPQWR